MPNYPKKNENAIMKAEEVDSGEAYYQYSKHSPETYPALNIAGYLYMSTCFISLSKW